MDTRFFDLTSEKKLFCRRKSFLTYSKLFSFRIVHVLFMSSGNSLIHWNRRAVTTSHLGTSEPELKKSPGCRLLIVSMTFLMWSTCPLYRPEIISGISLNGIRRYLYTIISLLSWRLIQCRWIGNDYILITLHRRIRLPKTAQIETSSLSNRSFKLFT